MNNEDYRERFIDAYVEAAIWTDIQNAAPEASTVLLETCQWCRREHPECGTWCSWCKQSHKLTEPCSRRNVMSVCEDFITTNWRDLHDLDPQRAGTDFWLAKNGYDGGFWGRGGDARDNRLNLAAKAHGSSHAEYDEQRHVIRISE